MTNPRLEKLARLLTEYSLRLKPGKIVLIRGNAIGAPLIRECYRAALRCGAYPFVEVSIDGVEEIFYREAGKDQLKWVSPIAKFKMQKIDAYLGVWADTNTKSLTSADPKRIAIADAAHEPIMNIFMKRAAAGEVKWVGTQWPCNSSAQDAEMSLEEYEEFAFGAERSGWIEVLGVHPRHMGKGVGKLLGYRLLSIFKRKGATRVFTAARWDSVDLLSFFKSVGFSGVLNEFC
jgi:aminopeptidase